MKTESHIRFLMFSKQVQVFNLNRKVNRQVKRMISIRISKDFNGGVYFKTNPDLQTRIEKSERMQSKRAGCPSGSPGISEDMEDDR